MQTQIEAPRREPVRIYGYQDMPSRRKAREILRATSVAQCGAVAASKTASGNPLTIITSTTVKLWVDSQLGTGTNAWNDQSGNGNHFAEPTNPPTLTTLGGNPCYVSNGTTQRFRNATLTVSAGQWYWFIARQISGTGSLCGGKTSAYGACFGTGVAPELSIYSGVSGAPNSSAAYGSWVRIEFLCTGTGADYLKIGSNSVTGTGGSNAETGWDIFCRAGVQFGAWAIAAIAVAAARPNSGERTGMDSYGASRFASVGF